MRKFIEGENVIYNSKVWLVSDHSLPDHNKHLYYGLVKDTSFREIRGDKISKIHPSKVLNYIKILNQE